MFLSLRFLLPPPHYYQFLGYFSSGSLYKFKQIRLNTILPFLSQKMHQIYIFFTHPPHLVIFLKDLSAGNTFFSSNTKNILMLGAGIPLVNTTPLWKHQTPGRWGNLGVKVCGSTSWAVGPHTGDAGAAAFLGLISSYVK